MPKTERLKPLSLHPLTPEQAIRRMFQVADAKSPNPIPSKRVKAPSSRKRQKRRSS